MKQPLLLLVLLGFFGLYAGIRLVQRAVALPGQVRAPKEARDPQRDDVKATGMLGFASSNFWTIDPSLR